MGKIIRLGIIPLSIAAFGSLLNWTVILANGGMPVKDIPLVYSRWVALTPSTNLWFLGDILPWYLSIGDIIMFGSLLAYAVIVVVWVTRNRKRKLIAAY